MEHTLLSAIWDSPWEVEVIPYRIHKVNGAFTLIRADDHTPHKYIGIKPTLSQAVGLLVEMWGQG